jgi:hypothetical protein
MGTASAAFSFESNYFETDVSDDVEVSSSRNLFQGASVNINSLIQIETAGFQDCAGDSCRRQPLRNRTAILANIDKFPVVNHFSMTLSYKFARTTYEKIKELISPRISIFCGIDPFCCNTSPCKGFKKNAGCEIYILLRNAINTVPPCMFIAYLNAFNKGDYVGCYLMLEKYFSCECTRENDIIECLCRLNVFKKCVPITCIVFFDIESAETNVVQVKCAPVLGGVCLYLPRQVLCLGDFLCLSFCLDEYILKQLAIVTKVDYASVYARMLKRYYKAFQLLTEEQRIIEFLRIKFFAFNAIAYQISLITAAEERKSINQFILNFGDSCNDLFFRSFALGIGLLNKS